MDEEEYGVTVTVDGQGRYDVVAVNYDVAVAFLREVLRGLPSTASASSEIVDLVDERIVVHDEGTVAELLAWTNGAPRC